MELPFECRERSILRSVSDQLVHHHRQRLYGLGAQAYQSAADYNGCIATKIGKFRFDHRPQVGAAPLIIGQQRMGPAQRGNPALNGVCEFMLVLGSG